jgi:hypothetical protein
VGGLHTVYTKLKRLDIQPLVCNVDQVRALRSLGAIQPGVNRCKLIGELLWPEQNGIPFILQKLLTSRRFMRIAPTAGNHDAKMQIMQIFH